MIVLKQTRRATRSAAEKVRAALIELDELFQDYRIFEVDETTQAEDVYVVVHDSGGYVVMLTDPSLT